jgi:hypothetical protein
VSRDWDAGTYDRVSAPQRQWAGAVIDRLRLRGDEIVLDAVMGRLGPDPELDYVRLNISARKRAAPAS